MASREQVYREQLQALEVYDPAFEPEIKTLADLERRWTRVRKAWSASAAPGCKPSFLDPHYEILTQLEREILTHREALGLTPKAMRRIKGAYYETRRVGELVEDQPRENVTMLDIVRQKYSL